MSRGGKRTGEEDRRARLLSDWAAHCDARAIQRGGAGLLRSRLLAALHLGWVEAGDRLPSIREVVRASGLPKHAVSRAYDRLEAEGLVEKRARSGVYVAAQDRSGSEPLGETAEWLAKVITEACAHRIRLPYLPELIQSWTSAVPLCCCCIESNHDARVALAMEVTHQFGLEAVTLDAGRIPPVDSVKKTAARKLPRSLRHADIIVTTVFHAAAARAWADMLGKPLVIAAFAPEYVAALEEWLSRAPLTVICVDAGFGDQLGAMFGADRKRVRVITAGDRSAIAGLPRTRPVLLTRAAYEVVGTLEMRLLHPLSGAFGPAFASQMARALVQLNLESQRI